MTTTRPTTRSANRVSYKVTDQWRVEMGANVFFGSHKHTFFGQFEDNSNLYFATRYSF